MDGCYLIVFCISRSVLPKVLDDYGSRFSFSLLNPLKDKALFYLVHI
jgi:hypothetical protein